MWDRKELKAQGKLAYQNNRLTCILAGLLLSIAGGAGGGLASSPSFKLPNSADTPKTETVSTSDIDPETAVMAVAVVLVICLIAFAIAFVFTAFLLNPLLVGCRKFFIENALHSQNSINESNIGLAFHNNYMNIVGAMFSTQIFVFLWSLLLIVPGIIRAYDWRMVPYIISENPSISGEEARNRSEQMMSGQKWDTFVLDLSFLGWMILGGFTFGILNLLFTTPYKAATDAELYLTLDGRATEYIEYEYE